MKNSRTGPPSLPAHPEQEGVRLIFIRLSQVGTREAVCRLPVFMFHSLRRMVHNSRRMLHNLRRMVHNSRRMVCRLRRMLHNSRRMVAKRGRIICKLRQTPMQSCPHFILKTAIEPWMHTDGREYKRVVQNACFTRKVKQISVPI